MEVHVHPKSGARIEGSRLGHGTELTEHDVYDSTDGTWQPCPCPGLAIMRSGCRTMWVRPFKVPSTLAQELLGCLTIWETKPCCVARPYIGGQYVVIPSKNFNWDGRVDTPRVTHQECVQELIDCGCLIEEEPDRIHARCPVLVVTSAARRFAEVHLHRRSKN
jgi:hypothetical protein